MRVRTCEVAFNSARTGPAGLRIAKPHTASITGRYNWHARALLPPRSAAFRPAPAACPPLVQDQEPDTPRTPGLVPPALDQRGGVHGARSKRLARRPTAICVLNSQTPTGLRSLIPFAPRHHNHHHHTHTHAPLSPTGASMMPYRVPTGSPLLPSHFVLLGFDAFEPADLSSRPVSSTWFRSGPGLGPGFGPFATDSKPTPSRPQRTTGDAHPFQAHPFRCLPIYRMPFFLMMASSFALNASTFLGTSFWVAVRHAFSGDHGSRSG